MSASEGFLEEMARASRARARRLAHHAPRQRLAELVGRATPALPLTLSPRGFDLLAEVKFASPSAGVLARTGGPAVAAQRSAGYAAAGAAAISVLTEPARFGGSLGHLRAAVRATPAPVMRKDFLVDPLQVLEARAAGASGVLLIVRMLDASALVRMLERAGELGLFVLLEAFDAHDLERAARALERRPAGATWLVGVNARDLRTLEVSPERHLTLAPLLPSGVPCVAESGIESPSDARAAVTAGYRLALVGTALMRAPDPSARGRELLEAGRAMADRANPGATSEGRT